jgi:serine/threonine protein kinase
MTGQAHNPAGGPGRDLTSSETGSVPPVPVALGTASSYPVPAVPLQTSELAPDDTALAVARQGDSMTLGRYQLLERIGEGGMAEIFIAATHGAEGFVRKFVVKRMHAHLARNRDAVNQFIDEARLQSALVHSNIVPVFDFGKVADDYFLTMEYIHGRDLDWLVRRHVEVFGKPLSVPVAFHIMSEVLEALSYAHSRADADGKVLGIVHRDVAPGNVLISYRGEVKLSDFGIARAERRLSRTEMGLLKGNVSFMSPEQARGEQVDRRSDLFSTGMVLFFCLTGQLRHGHNDTLVNQLLRAASGPIATDMDVLAQFPPLAADVLRRALTRDPARRYQTARDFARDLGGHFTSGRTELADLLDQLFPVGERRAQ